MTATISVRIWKKRAAAKLCRLQNIQVLLPARARLSHAVTEFVFSGTNRSKKSLKEALPTRTGAEGQQAAGLPGRG